MSRANPWRIGLGPVFAYERIAASRRWQGYALRSLFLLALLAALILVWERTNGSAPASAISYYTELARSVFIGVVGTQLALVLLAGTGSHRGGDLPRPRARNLDPHALDRPFGCRDRSGQAGRTPASGALAAGLHPAYDGDCLAAGRC